MNVAQPVTPPSVDGPKGGVSSILSASSKSVQECVCVCDCVCVCVCVYVVWRLGGRGFLYYRSMFPV